MMITENKNMSNFSQSDVVGYCVPLINCNLMLHGYFLDTPTGEIVDFEGRYICSFMEILREYANIYKGEYKAIYSHCYALIKLIFEHIEA